MQISFDAGRGAVAFAAAVALFSGCSARGGNPAAPPAVPAYARSAPETATSILKLLVRQRTIGSVVDPLNGAGNPYGLTVSPIASGKIGAGDLVVCNFNARSNVQGTGESIVALNPKPGSSPRHISANEALQGCDALAIGSDGRIWAAAMVANDNPVLELTGRLTQNITGKPFDQPWGQTFAQPPGGKPVYYESNAGDGSIVRINLGATYSYQVIATGFPVNHGVPGTALAPSGLAYDPRIDTLYFADGMNDTIVAFKNVSTIGRDGIKAVSGGMAFTGPSSADARIVFAGKPLNGPISTALLFNGNLVVGNTLDPDGQNLLIEIAPSGRLLDVRNVDKGAAGALFGIVATGTTAADTKLYFNDDNANNVQVLEQ